MAEYIEREALIESIRNGDGTPMQKLFAECCVRSVPIADVVEVIRCKDCRHSEICPDALLWCNECERIVGQDGYCYKGERRNDDG